MEPHQDPIAWSRYPQQYKHGLTFLTRNALDFTISPPDMPISDLESKFISVCYELSSQTSDWFLVKEYQQDTGRIHFHGSVRFKNKWEQEFFRSKQNMCRYQRRIGFIKTQRQPGPKWIEYCFKDVDNPLHPVGLQVCFSRDQPPHFGCLDTIEYRPVDDDDPSVMVTDDSVNSQ